MSSKKYFILKVISAQIPELWKASLPGHRRIMYTIKRKETHPSSIVEISFGDVIQRTGVAENTTSPIWNESFLISRSQQKSNLDIIIKVKADDICIGQAELDLDELMDKNEIEVPLLPVSKPGSKRDGAIILQLEAADLRAASICAVQNLSRVIQQRSVDASNLSQLIGDAASDIENILELVDDIAQLNSYLKLSLGLLTLLGKRISQQLKFNKELKYMKDSLDKALELINNTDGTNPTKYLVLIQDRFLEFIIYCCIFIQDYIRHSLIGQAYRGDKKDTIEGFKEKLGELRKDLGEALLIQIDKKVDGIDGKVDGVDAKLDDLLEHKKKEILEELKKKLRPMPVTDLEADRSKCMEGTRVQVLDTINSWVRNTSFPNIFLLTGGAGTGKSTIARTIAQQYERKGELGAYMFFIRGKTDPKATFTTITSMVLRTVAYKLAHRIPRIAELIYAEIGDDIESRFPSSEILFDKLLHKPLHSLMNTENTKVDAPILVVLDALDECGDSVAQEELTNFIIDKLSDLPPIFRFLITSRPEKGVASLSQSTNSDLLKHKYIDPGLGDCKRDVLLFIRHEMERLKKNEGFLVDDDWPWDENMVKLGDAAGGLFIWASTAIKYIEEKEVDQFESLKDLVKNSKTLSKNLHGLYATVLRNSFSWRDLAANRRFCSVFSLILFGKTLLTGKEIDDILSLRAGTTQGLLSRFRSFVTYNGSSPIRINHTSLYDYLIECEEEEWYIDEDIEKNKIALHCFGLMKSQLRFNICDLETSFKFNRDVPDLQERISESIHPGLLYVCRYWASHLRDAPYSDGLLSELDNFTYKLLLHWLEVLSLTGCLCERLEPVLECAIGWVKNKGGHIPSGVSSFLEDTLHHVFEFIQPISESAPHIYMSFLPLKRFESDVARHYAKDMKEPTCIEHIGDRVKATLGCTKKINVGSGISSISRSYHGNRILSSSPFGLSLWNVDSGKLIRGPFGGDASISFSYHRNRAVVVNQDGAVNEWDTDTGEKLYDLPRVYNGHVTSVAVDDQQYYATGFEDGAIQLWGRWEGTMIGEPMRGHSKKVLALSFSGFGYRYLASGSEDQSIIVWDVEGGEKKYAPLKGHSGPITSLTFTYWSKSIVSGSLDGTVRLWDVVSGEMLHALSASGMGGVYSVAYCGEQHILSGSEDGIIRIWDTLHSEVPPKKCIGHTDKVISFSVAYAHSGIHFASGSSDGTIRVWDVEGGHTIVEGEIQGVAVSPNGEYLVSVSNEQTVSIWRIETGELIKGPLKHYGLELSVSFSPDGTHFASGSNHGTVRIWNLDGESINTWSCEAVWAVCFSPDGKRVASAVDNTIQVRDSKSGELTIKPFEGHSERINTICYSQNGRRIISGSSDKTIRSWDASNGTLLLTLQGHSDGITSVTYSHDGLYILSGSNDRTIRIWHANNGEPTRDPIKAHEYGVCSVCFSPDARYFVSGSMDKTAQVWNTSTGELLFKVNVSSFVSCVVFLPSPDSGYIKFASASSDGLIRIWSVDIDSKERIWNAPDDDGWVIGNDGNLLYWLPSDIRPSLIGGPCVRTLNSRFSTTLTLSEYQGSQWTSCFPSSTIV